MSLELAAKHLETQGRGGDTQLVHMSPNELRALNKLSIDHIGKPLSINPTTGLHEAGFLSSILPTIAGVALSAAFPAASPFLLAGGVGLLSAALTGDIGQGIMAGLGAWGGTSLAKDLAGASTLAQEGGDVVGKTLGITQDAALNSGVMPYSKDLASSFSVDPVKSFMGQQNFVPDIASQAKSFIPELNAAKSITPQFDVVGNAVNFPQGASAASNVNWPNIGSGAKYAVSNPIDFLSKPGVGMHVAGAAIPPLLAMSQPEYAPLPTATQKKNPFNLKSITSDFQGSFPTQPNPYPQAQYPNYQTNPYTTYANHGGLMNIEHFKAGGSDYKKLMDNVALMQEGFAGLDKRSDAAPIVPRDPGDAYGGPGIVEDEVGYEGMSPDQKTYEKLKALRKKTYQGDMSKGLQPMGSLGNINLMPAELRQRMLEDQAKQQIVQESAKGGLMSGHLGDYSDGGRLLKGPGDGVSDSIPATIGGKQAARLAEGEFVIPARIVSELGNGSTDAGAKRLYAMMDRIKAKRRKAKDIAADTKSYHYLPA